MTTDGGQAMGDGGWNYADVWETVARRRGDAPAIVCGDAVRSWSDFDARANGIAAALLEVTSGRQAKVAQLLYNCPELLEGLYGIVKAGLVPVNVNYRYVASELEYLLDNADVEVVMFNAEFADVAAAARPRAAGVRLWLCVGDPADCPPWATPFDEVARAGTAGAAPAARRSGDDLFLIYTGGTTGHPKGVMWPQHDLYNLAAPRLGDPPSPDLEAVERRLEGPSPAVLPACPLIHGTGLFVALLGLTAGGTVVLLGTPGHDTVAMLDAVERHGVAMLGIVGDAYARPMLRALEAEPERWSLGGLRTIFSSGVAFTDEVKHRLVELQPQLTISDLLSSTEAIAMAESTTSSDASAATAVFVPLPRMRVLDDDDRDVEPGSDVVGRLAVRPPVPVGYYKDPEKTARTFPVIDGVRHAVPGDYARVLADGTVQLVGRGSACINTGGEKVFSEEVEDAIRGYPGVEDVVVVGVPDERLGHAVCALVTGSDALAAEPRNAVRDFVKERLAGYKAPRHVFVVDDLDRAPNGKVNLRRLRELAVELVERKAEAPLA